MRPSTWCPSRASCTPSTPPLFVVLVVYSVGGTAISLRLGRPLVSLNFQQEAQEANLR